MRASFVYWVYRVLLIPSESEVVDEGIFVISQCTKLLAEISTIDNAKDCVPEGLFVQAKGIDKFCPPVIPVLACFVGIAPPFNNAVDVSVKVPPPLVVGLAVPDVEELDGEAVAVTLGDEVAFEVFTPVLHPEIKKHKEITTNGATESL